MSPFCAGSKFAQGQLVITENTSAMKLASYLVGNGVVISNASLTSGGRVISTGMFLDTRGGIIGIDSGVVLTSGRAKTDRTNWGVDGDGSTQASSALADEQLGLPGDNDLATELGITLPQVNDAIVLQFDFVPLGDTVRFRYVMGSEEYTPAFVCTFNDAFAFFISGPGITGKKNIALVPNTSTPVSIKNVNNIPAGCINNPAYFVDNKANRFFTYDGHTTVLTAISAVQPCQTYTLKLVIADVGDDEYDTGVFLEAKSLSSNVVKITGLTQFDSQGNNYLVEGCVNGQVEIKRPYATAAPLIVALNYGGTAINGVDVQALPATVTIPANSDRTSFNLQPIIDNLPEGIEELRIYASAGCSLGSVPNDSIVIQVRDFDTLDIAPRKKGLCRGASVQLAASPGFTSYTWDPDPTLSSLNVRNPVAAPVNDSNWYICSAVLGNCHARDSALIKRKNLEFVSQLDVNCKNESTGQIQVAGGWEWEHPAVFWLNNRPQQTDSVFNNLPVNNYLVKMRDVSGCIDSVPVNLIQAYPDLVATVTATPASCSGDPDGAILISPAGGLSPYTFSIDNGINFNTNGSFPGINAGSYQTILQDLNGCQARQPIAVTVNDTVTLVSSADATICEGKSQQFSIVSNAAKFDWTPVATLDDPTLKNPKASPVTTTRYYVTASSGICVHKDSINVFVNAAPMANAGPDTSICFGGVVQLHASGGTNFKWYPPSYLSNTFAADPFANPSATINYLLNVGDANGCVSLRPDTVKVKVVPVVKLFAGNDTVVAVNQPLQLGVVDINHSGVVTYLWTPSYGLNDPLSGTPIATLDRDVTYVVTARTLLGCVGYDQIKVKTYKGPEIYVPNAFTPNKDGLNDQLRAIPAGIKNFKYFRIYDRWGKLVFETSDPAKGWDGTVKGIASSTGTYVWMAEAIDYLGNAIARKGSVIIIR